MYCQAVPGFKEQNGERIISRGKSWMAEGMAEAVLA
jgi:hypothetical protein